MVNNAQIVKLCNAAYSGNLDIVKKLLSHVEDVNAKNGQGESALHLAIRAGHIEIVRSLLGVSNVDVAQTDNSSCIVLHNASMKGHVEIVKELLPHIQDVNAKNGQGESALHLATSAGHIEIVRSLLDVPNVDVTQMDNIGYTALHNTSTKGHVEIVKELLPHIQDVNAKNGQGENALHLATRAGHIEIVRSLLGVPNVDVTQMDDAGYTALHNASMEGHVEIVKELLPHIQDVKAKNGQGENALHLAAWDGHIEIVRSLLGVPNVDVTQMDNVGYNALHFASMKGHVDIVKELLPHIQDINAKSRYGENALDLAVIMNHIRVVRSLLGVPNVDVTQTDNAGYTALHNASTKGHVEIVKELLPHIQDVNAKNGQGESALHLATRADYIEIVRSLLGVPNVDVTQTDNTGYTALHFVSMKGHLEIVKELLPHIQDVNAKSRYGENALDLAVMMNRIRVVRSLLGVPNVDVTHKDDSGNTALHNASTEGHVEIVKELLPYIHDVNAKNGQGESALDLAIKMNHIEIVRSLLGVPNIDVTQMDRFGNTFLHNASTEGHVEFVKELLPHIQDVNAKNGQGESALDLAVKMNHIEIVRSLLGIPNVDVTQMDRFGNTTLHNASMEGYVEIVKELLPHIQDVNAENGQGESALDLAVKMNHIEIVRSLLGVPNIDVTQMDRFGNTFLHNASTEGHVEFVKELLPHIQDVNAKNGQGESALDLAVKMNYIEIVRSLLDVPNVDVTQMDIFGNTFLHNASREGHVEFVKELLPHIQDVNAKNGQGESALDLAVKMNHIKIVRSLLSIPNVDVTQMDRFGNTALHNASIKGYVEIVKELLPHIQDVNVENGQGENALHLATWAGNTEIVRTLLRITDVEINATNNDGNTSIELAHDRGFDHIQTLLINTEGGKRYMDNLYRDRQVYVDVANAILVGAALIASVTFTSWLQPSLNYTLSGDSYPTEDPYPSNNYPKYVDVEHNSGLGVFWVFNSLSFYFAISTVVLGACSVLPRRRSFIAKNVVKLRRNLLRTSGLLALSVFFVLVAFGTTGSIVLMPMLKFRSYMIVPTTIGGIVCMICLGYLAYNIWIER